MIKKKKTNRQGDFLVVQWIRICALNTEGLGSIPAWGTKILHTTTKPMMQQTPNAAKINQFSSVQFSRSVVSDSLRPHGLQHTRPPYPSPTSRVYSNTCPLSQWCHPTISSSVAPSPPAFNLSQHQGLFKWVSSLHQMARVSEFQLQHQSFQWIFRTDFL